MQQFVLAYHGGKKFESKEAGQAHMKAWMDWTENLSDAVVNPGMYFGMSKTVSADGIADDGGSNPLAGITILQAETLETALEMAQKCPHVNIGGTIEVAQVMQM